MNNDVDSMLPAPGGEISTYEDLIESFKRSNPNSYKNHVSALGSFLESCGLDKTAAPGPEFDVNYEAKVSVHLLTFEHKGTRDNNKSRLKTLKKHWEVISSSKVQNKFHIFSEAFSYYFNAAKKQDSKLNYVSLAEKVGSSNGKIRTFATQSIQPNHSSLDLIRLLESELGAPKDALTRFVKSEDDTNLLSHGINHHRTVYDNKIAKLRLVPYRLSEEQITEDLKNGFQSFFNFKTNIWGVRPLERNEPWKLRPVARFNGPAWELKYCSTEDDEHLEDNKQYAPSGLNRFGMYRTFFGALSNCVEGGNHPYEPKNFRFVWLADSKLVKIAIEFLFGRMGQYTVTTEALISFSMGLLMHRFGYVRQHPEFRSQLPTPVEASAWEEWCDVQLKELKLALEELKKGGHIKRARDPKVRIKEYLDRDQPISVLFELSTNMREHLDTHPLFTQTKFAIVLERDYLLARMITVQPLRIDMFKIMTYRKDNSGSLYRRVDGTWAIRFAPEDFKNLKGAAGDSGGAYDVSFIDESVGRDIERFVDQIRTKFKDDSDNLFVAYQARSKVEGRLTANLSATFMKRTRQFLKDSMGFGPHACRHIVTTDFLKKNPGQYDVAAAILHDRPETVRKNYEHLTVEDGHKVFQEYLAGVRKAYGGKQPLVKPELIQAILACLNNNKNIPAELRALLNELTNPEGKAA